MKKHPLALITFAAVILHAVIFSAFFPRAYLDRTGTDFTSYQTEADNLLAGRGFSLSDAPPYAPDTIRTPLYPLFLAAAKGVTGSYYPTLFLTLLLGATIPAAGMRIASGLKLGMKVQIAIGVLLMFEPHLVYYSLLYGTEGIVIPLAAWTIVAAVEVIERPRPVHAVLVGLLLGLVTLGRPIFQFVSVLLALCLAWSALGDRTVRRVRLICAGLVLAGAIIVVSPWLMRNYARFGAVDFSNIAWFNMYTRVAAMTEAVHAHSEFYPMWSIYLERLHQKGYVQHTPVLESDIYGYEYRQILKDETLATIRRYPSEFMLTQASAGWTVISQDSTVAILNGLGIVHAGRISFLPMVMLYQDGLIATLRTGASLLATPWAYAIIARFGWALLFLLSLGSVFVLPKRGPQRTVVAFLLLYELGLIAFSLNAGASADARYRTQFVFVELPLAFVALTALVRKKKLTETGQCPVCGAYGAGEPFAKKEEWRIFRCRNCWARFVHPMPSPDVVAAFYERQYFSGEDRAPGYADYEADKQASMHTLEAVMSKIAAAHPGPGSVLDVGAATGVFLQVARNHGWKVAGYEVSEEAARAAAGKGIRVATGTFSPEAFPEAPFDVVTMLDVIEHLPDPVPLLHTISDLLRPGGSFFINTPDAGSVYSRLMGRYWHTYVPPEHLVIYNERSLRILLKRCGFEVLWVGRVPKSFRLPYILKMLGRWTGLGFIDRCAQWSERKGMGYAIPLDLRDNIAVLARKAVKL